MNNVDETVEMIEKYLVNRSDVYWRMFKMKYGPESGKVIGHWSPSERMRQKAERFGSQAHSLDKYQIRKSLNGSNEWIGVLAISERNTCKWVALEITATGCESIGRDVATYVKNQVGLECVIIPIAKQTLLILVPLAVQVGAPEAHKMASHIAENAPLNGACVDYYPKTPTCMDDGLCRKGGFLMLLGKHPEDAQKIDLGVYERVASVVESNTLEKWQSACTKIVSVGGDRALEPEAKSNDLPF